MEVKIQSVKFDAGSHLEEFINRRMSKLSRFAENAVSADVTLKLDKDRQNGNKVAAVTLHIPGGSLVAEERSRTFEEAVDGCIDALKRQIEKRRDRI